MKKRIFAPIILSALLLSGCNFLPFGPDKTSGSTQTTNTSGTSGITTDEKAPTVESVTIKPTSIKLKPGASSTLTATVTGKNNPSTEVTWSSSNTSVVTVNGGVVTALSTAAANATATITATSKVDTSKSASCTVTILDPAALDDYTLLVYLCGSTLEYGPEYNSWGYPTGRNVIYGAASGDIDEMLKVSGQPDGVNIVIETGGSEQWQNGKIPNNQLGHFTIRNKVLVADTHITNANMAASKTLEDFLTWGMGKYPAKKYGLILWNHGGAVHGVCSDENYGGNDMLTTSEVASALKNSLLAAGADKFEWVGYDACIMSYADNISVISDYANYIISAQESEEGDGWAYDAWLPTLFNNPNGSTLTLLEKICTTFISQYSSGNNDQTLSVIDCSKVADFISAFNSYTSNFTTKSHFETISTAFESTPLNKFGEEVYGLADMISFLTKMKTQFSSYSTTELENATKAMVAVNKYGTQYSSNKPCGVNVFFAESLDSDYPIQAYKTDYTTADTKFSSWRSLNINHSSDWARAS